MKTRLSLLGLMWSSFRALLPLDSCFVDQTALAGSLSYKCWVSDCVEMKNKVESDSTTSNIRRFTDSHLCHRPYPRLGGRKRDAFLIRWSTRDVAGILGPTASLVFNINWTWNRRDQHESGDIYIPLLWRHHASSLQLCRSWANVGHCGAEKLLMQFTNGREPALFDELFNCVLQTIYCSGAREAPTLSFSEGREPLVPGLGRGGNYTISQERRD